MTAVAYQGDFIAWPGGCGFLGQGGSAPIAPHSHYAIQLAIGLPSGLRVQFGRHGTWQSCTAALFPSRAVHSIATEGCAMSAVLFIEPETPEGKALSALLQGQAQVLDADRIAAPMRRLEAAWRGQAGLQAVQDACHAIVRELAGTTAREPSDARVLAAIAFLRTRVGQPVTLAELAGTAHLSPSRFRHLFVQETGMPLRTYLLWRRLLHVYDLLMHGETLSAAAHAAGFADSAHLSRTARTMFGLPPSALQMRGPLSARLRGATLTSAGSPAP